MSENLEKDFETYDKLATSADNVPPWFADVTRTLGTRNITVELWNTLCQNVRKIASDCNTQDEFIRKLYTHLVTMFNDIKSLEDNANAAWNTAEYNSTTNVLDFKNRNNAVVASVKLTLPRLLVDIQPYEISGLLFTYRNSNGDEETSDIDLSNAVVNTCVQNIDSNVYEFKPAAAHAVVSFVHGVRDNINNAISEISQRVDTLYDINVNTTYMTTHATLTIENPTVQVRNSLSTAMWVTRPYKYSLGMYFNCQNATDRFGNALSNRSVNSLTMSAGSDYFVKIPVDIASGATVFVNCDSNNARGDYINKYGFLDASDKAIGSTYTLGTKATIPSNASPKFLILYKHTPATPLAEDLKVYNIRLYASNANVVNKIINSETPEEDTFNIYPSSVITAAFPNVSSDYCTFKYIQKLPREELI